MIFSLNLSCQLRLLIGPGYLPQITMQNKSAIALDKTWDITFARFLSYTTAGLGIGILSSVSLFKRRVWPCIISTGFALGLAYSESSKTFKSLHVALENDQVDLFIQGLPEKSQFKWFLPPENKD
ncbi:hypothetical protein ROZALSC1DRAFT_26736 [Rozella allomycis CSF55]|nr:hypothetical protein ROZALSC1DRAFT_26736 [Rozella allomycis CSF55]